MHTVLSALAVVPSAALAASTVCFYAQARGYRRRFEERRRADDAMLAAVGSFVRASGISSGAVIERLDESLRERDPAVDVVLALVPDGEELACPYASGERAAHYAGLRVRRDARDVIAARAALCGHRAAGSSGLLVPTDRHAVAVPMHDDQGLRAVIYVASAKAAGLKNEDALVRTIEHAALPYSHAISREADRIDATYDGLTGLLSPRAFRLRLSDAIDRARLRDGTVYSLWFIDTDHFKAVNDSHGHAAGDVVLQTIAELLREHTLSDVDIAGRNGGDEFCALLADPHKTNAIERAQRFCDAVRARNFGIPLQITASVGVATYPYDARTASELLEIADAAMYYSKQTGRDRVSFSHNGTAFCTYR